MSITAIIFTVLVIAMMLGPLMLVQPSRGQRKLAQLRNVAMSLGFKVRLQSIDNQSIAIYQKPWPLDGRKWCLEEWAVVLKNYSHEIHFFGSWDWQKKCTAEGDYHEAIATALGKLPTGVCLLEATKIGVNCYWDERGGEASLKVIDATLSDLISKVWSLSSV